MRTHPTQPTNSPNAAPISPSPANPRPNRQWPLLVLLGVLTITVGAYTVWAVHQQGWGLFGVFVRNLSSGGWEGQFALDFSCYLLLSGLWLMWRHRFRPWAVALGFAVMVLGIVAFAPYLGLQTVRAQGNLVHVLVGKRPGRL
jgi:hypothetical protein